MLSRDRLTDEKQLQADLDVLMRHMRTSEDNFLTLTTHIHQLIHPPETSLFANEHVQLHRNAANKIRTQNAEIEQYYSNVVQRWASSDMDGGEVLLKRVTYRILEIFFNSIGAINNKVPQVLQEYLRLKMACQKVLQEESIHKPYQLIKIVTDYEFKKLRKHIQLLVELTNHLQNGDLDSFSKSQLANFMESRPSNRDITCSTRSPFYSTFKIGKIRKEKQASKPQIPIPVSDKMKAVSFKKAKVVYDCLKDVMDVNRAQFIEDFTNHCQANKQMLFRQLLGKNKANHAVIIDFASKKRRMQHKIKNRALNEGVSEGETENQLPDETKSFSATRKNLLLKLKVNDKPPKALPSQLFRKTSKFDQIRSRMKSYNRERALEEQRAGKATQALLNQNQEETIQMTQCNQSVPLEERLPILNKRAHSVDQNYKLPQAETPQVRTLSNSLKINEQLKVKGKGQKVQMLPAKIKLQLKSFNAVTSLQVNKKLGKVGEFSKYLYF